MNERGWKYATRKKFKSDESMNPDGLIEILASPVVQGIIYPSIN
jgi:hypothetical protein